ncbi:short chain alcohol dehydrogenase protein [Rutstroemia sp. NJR-2017a WRK4]|nr:short chain alcohol dehydrogenase protein [Rutstroemia sp. NJR-2017a WRK4]
MSSQAPTPSKAILISGGARGIGRCLCRTFLENGHRVFILDIDEPELTHTTTVHLKAYSSRLASSLCDLRNTDDIRSKVKQAADFFGGHIDVLINNGGIAHPYWKDGMTMEDPDTLQQWQAYIETNLTAPFACLPYMKAPTDSAAQAAALEEANAGPCIIHIGSFRSQQSDPNQEGYASAKAGLMGLMHSMAISCAPLGIRVNLVAPGRIKVAHECKEGDEKGREWRDTVEEGDVSLHATNRPGRPEDIVQAAEYFMGAGFVTGQALVVDGGVTKMKSS